MPASVAQLLAEAAVLEAKESELTAGIVAALAKIRLDTAARAGVRAALKKVRAKLGRQTATDLKAAAQRLLDGSAAPVAAAPRGSGAVAAARIGRPPVHGCVQCRFLARGGRGGKPHTCSPRGARSRPARAGEGARLGPGSGGGAEEGPEGVSCAGGGGGRGSSAGARGREGPWSNATASGEM